MRLSDAPPRASSFQRRQQRQRNAVALLVLIASLFGGLFLSLLL
jgi:hypothetical protein